MEEKEQNEYHSLSREDIRGGSRNLISYTSPLSIITPHLPFKSDE